MLVRPLEQGAPPQYSAVPASVRPRWRGVWVGGRRFDAWSAPEHLFLNREKTKQEARVQQAVSQRQSQSNRRYVSDNRLQPPQ